jgi:NAD(P)-dependent dehydrogenase (short-subunit alcohol dehydrogenase family)
MSVLVVGAQPGSLGDAVVRECRDDVVTAGLATDEWEPDWPLDVTSETADDALWEIMRNNGVKHVVCTVGINHPTIAWHCESALAEHLLINVIGVMRVLNAWLSSPVLETEDGPSHFVAISSNSARIARRNSLPYCTSKAALSMAIRCVAREYGGALRSIYCYEPGLIATRATREVAERLSRVGNTGELRMPNELHRMPNQHDIPLGVHPAVVAEAIVNNLNTEGSMLNGTCIPFDGGEQ